MKACGRTIGVICTIGLVAAGCKNNSNELKVAAAASLTPAYTEMGEAFADKTGIQVKFTFSSSGKLAALIERGGPYDVFAAASIKYTDQVIKAGVAEADTRRSYARGRLVVWTPSKPLGSLEDLTDPKFATVSLAQPEVAPYGRAARQALEKAGIWSSLRGRLAYGANVRQAMQHAETGNSDAALTALSLVIGGSGHYLVIDESLHDPLEQGIVVCGASKRKADAQAFVDFVDSEAGHAILATHGLLQPGESLP